VADRLINKPLRHFFSLALPPLGFLTLAATAASCYEQLGPALGDSHKRVYASERAVGPEISQQRATDADLLLDLQEQRNKAMGRRTHTLNSGLRQEAAKHASNTE
jgi:hypothetical protein